MDKELIKIFSEREAVLIRMEINERFNEAKSELERLKSENEMLNKTLDERIRSVKSDVSDVALDKTLSIVAHVRNWILIFGLFVTALAFLFGFLGIKNIGENLSSHFKTEVEKWLRFEPQDGPAKAKLDEIRTQAILDAYSIKLARSKSSPYGVRSIELNTLEQERILSILLDEKTTYADFIDALRLLSSNRGILRLWHPEDEIGKKILSILDSESYSPSKKGQVLSYMRQDGALLPYSKDIITHPTNSYSVKSVAFENISLFDVDYAKKFALTNINHVEDEDFRSDLAVFLAKKEPDTSELLGYINQIKQEKADGWQRHLFKIVEAVATNSSKEGRDNIGLAINEFSFLIENGAKLRLSDSDWGARYITFAFDDHGTTYYSGIESPEELLSNHRLINGIVASREGSVDWVEKVISSLEIVEMGFNYTSVTIQLDGNTRVKLKNNQLIEKDDIVGKSWLRMESFSGHMVPMLVWRDPVGEIRKETFVGIENIRESQVSISYDKKIISNLSMRKLNNDMWGW